MAKILPGRGIMSPNGKSMSSVDVSAKKLLDDLNQIKTGAKQEQGKVKKPFKREIVWKNVVVFAVGHAVGIYGLYLGLFHTNPIHFWIGFSLGYLYAIQGILLGAHRYYTHRCFKASKTLQVIMLISQTMCSQNCMYVWVRDHRQHHKYSDTDADPHNANNGFFFSHVGWLLSRKHPDVIEKGKGVDMSDLDADPLVQFQMKHYNILWVVFALIYPTALPMVLFNYSLKNALIFNVVRVVLTLNITWLVNSWAHLYGTRPFDKDIKPVESAVTSFFTLGEGWHNYHHTFPWDYKASEFGAKYNVTRMFIEFYARIGMVWDLKEASDETILARASRTGDGTPFLTQQKQKQNL